MDRTTELAPLGPQRLRLLECLGGNNPRLPGYFTPATGADIFAEFRQYAADLSARWAGESDTHTVSLLAAARLLGGDLLAAQVILDRLPAEATQLDHGAGICLVAPLYAMQSALPLPADLADTRRWLAGSAAQSGLRTWLAIHGERLVWNDVNASYQLAAIC